MNCLIINSILVQHISDSSKYIQAGCKFLFSYYLPPEYRFEIIKEEKYVWLEKGIHLELHWMLGG